MVPCIQHLGRRKRDVCHGVRAREARPATRDGRLLGRDSPGRGPERLGPTARMTRPRGHGRCDGAGLLKGLSGLRPRTSLGDHLFLLARLQSGVKASSTHRRSPPSPRARKMATLLAAVRMRSLGAIAAGLVCLVDFAAAAPPPPPGPGPPSKMSTCQGRGATSGTDPGRASSAPSAPSPSSAPTGRTDCGRGGRCDCTGIADKNSEE